MLQLRGWIPLLVIAMTVACGPKVIVESVYETDEVRVSLRHTVEGGEPVDRGHAHPLVISDVRMAHILATISHQDSAQRTRPSIRSQHLYELAEGLSLALGRASPDEEAIAAIEFTERRLGFFAHAKVTSLRAFADGDFLAIEFYHLESSLERDIQEARDREYKVPSQPLKIRGSFRLVAGQGQALRGAQRVQIDWRDPFFGKAVSMRMRGGRLQRRTVLMEEPDAEPPPADEAGPNDATTPSTAPEAPPTALRDAQLRALDQLDAARRSGLVTEADFQRRRRLILDGRLEEAGYGSPEP